MGRALWKFHETSYPSCGSRKSIFCIHWWIVRTSSKVPENCYRWIVFRYYLSVELCSQMKKFGDICMMTVTDEDPEQSRKIATAYDSIMKGFEGEPLEVLVSCKTLHLPLDTAYKRRDCRIAQAKISWDETFVGRLVVSCSWCLGCHRAKKEGQDGLRPLLL